MGLFNNLTTTGLEETEDRLGGFALQDTNIYPATIKVAYAGKSEGGAQNVTFVLNLNGTEYNETVYVTNKKGENWFPNKDDKTKKVPLPGFTLVDDICQIVTGKGLAEQDTEEKIVKVYDREERKELPKSVPVLTGLTGQKIDLAIVKQTVNKQVKNESTGDYEPTDETRDENVIEKAFHPEFKVTVVEARKAATEGKELEATFYGKWLEKHKGVTRDRTKKGATNSGGTSGAPQAGQAQKKTTSLFGNK